jgi:UDP-GlcNAc:undecaprenyl-phosphate GlcNAc-1-phosphate transferase
MTKRIMQGKSPFKPDRYHVHHIFLRYGMGRAKAVQVILGLSFFLGCLSLLGPVYGVAEKWLFSIYALYFIVYLVASFFIIGVFRYSLKRRQQREHLAASDIVLRYIFGSFDLFKLFRKSKRYNVRLAMNCKLDNGEPEVRGQLLNISQSGCMVKMPDLESEQKLMTLTLHLPKEMGYTAFEVKAEHLWTSSVEEAHFHGFRFIELGPEKTKEFSSHMEHLAWQQQQIHTKHATV